MLEPAGVELAPLLDVLGRRVPAREAAGHGEAADVHRPVRDPGEGEAQAARDLLPHRRPGRGDVPRPRGRGVALLAGEGRAGQDEDPLVGGGGALPLVDALAVDERVGVQHPRPGAHRGRVHVGALQVELGHRLHEVGLARVHPPRVDAAAEEGPLDLLPEELPGPGAEGVEEGVGVAAADPVLEPGAQRALVEEALRAHRLEVLVAGVELGPDRDHEARVAVVDRLHPAVGVGEARGVEAVRAPRVLRPVEPVLHDVVEGDAAGAEAVHRVEALLLRLVALPALPEAEGPPRHHRRLAGEAPVAGDHVVEGRAVGEVVVDAVAHLRPEGRRALLRRRLPREAHRLHPLVLRPLDLQGVAALRERHPGEVLPRKPPLPPVIGHEPAVHPHPDPAVRVELEEVVAGLRDLDGALPPHADRTFRGQGGVDTEVRLPRPARDPYVDLSRPRAWRRASRRPRRRGTSRSARPASPSRRGAGRTGSAPTRAGRRSA